MGRHDNNPAESAGLHARRRAAAIHEAKARSDIDKPDGRGCGRPGPAAASLAQGSKRHRSALAIRLPAGHARSTSACKGVFARLHPSPPSLAWPSRTVHHDRAVMVDASSPRSATRNGSSVAASSTSPVDKVSGRQDGRSAPSSATDSCRVVMTPGPRCWHLRHERAYHTVRSHGPWQWATDWPDSA